MSENLNLQFSLSDLLFFPVTMPLKMVGFVAERLAEIVHGELYDEQKLYKNLMDLELRFEMGDLSVEEYDRHHNVLISRLQEVQAARRREQAATRIQGES